MEVYLAVKRKALGRLEEALDRWQNSPAAPTRELLELTVVEKDAAKALGIDPARYRAIQETVARLTALKGRQEDALRLERELRRSVEELRFQAQHTKDQATREFLQAQITSLQEALARLAEERTQQTADEASFVVLSRYRVEMAQLQARQDRVARRLREAWGAAAKRPAASRPAP
ncbi:MAG: hypothetical protein NZ869_03775 [Thermoanaerobaculum sp.]|nr:hypothetical protein [Thermoanaerobaculum sp.]MDW7966627.1 hypothetical protein [Thermoanaerobaculum sp.]